MTEETIEKMISDWYLSTPRDINELSEQLLEQHEAEMVDFYSWVSLSKESNDYQKSILPTRVNPSEVLPSKKMLADLLERYKKRQG